MVSTINFLILIVHSNEVTGAEIVLDASQRLLVQLGLALPRQHSSISLVRLYCGVVEVTGRRQVQSLLLSCLSWYTHKLSTASLLAQAEPSLLSACIYLFVYLFLIIFLFLINK